MTRKFSHSQEMNFTLKNSVKLMLLYSQILSDN